MNVGSLFTGCGGLDLGLERAGYRIAWACESDPACRRVLRRHRPELRIFSDVRKLDAEPVDVLAGGFPCQDLSYAGRGDGLEGDRSGLWFAFADAVRLLRPRLVLVENVPGLATRGQGRVLYDLAEAGYVGWWRRLRAADVGAPHLRERIFIFAADAECDGSRVAAAGVVPAPAGGEPGEGDQRQRLRADAGYGDLASADSRSLARPETRERNGGSGEGSLEVALGSSGEAVSRAAGRFGQYEDAVRRWERISGRAAPRPTDDRGRLEPVFVEWMLGFPENWTADETRTDRLRMLGNSVQVQVGELAGRLLAEMA